MSRRLSVTVLAVISLGVGLAGQAPSPSANATGDKKWTPPRTPDGHPDLQGVWDYRSATPLQRPTRFGNREFMTPEEVVEYERLAATREDGRPPDNPRTEQSVHPVWWLDYGKKVVKTARTSLIVNPPDGKIPPQTPEAQKRAALRRAEANTHGPADSYENRSLFERCLTRGAPEGLLPGPYNNNLRIVQAAGYVVLFTEMIHEARIVPMDGRPRSNVAHWLGDPRGRWEGDTLVVDSLNFSEKSAFRNATPNLHLVERFTRLDANTLEYRFTVEDPTTWTRPWTVAYPMLRTDEQVYEYACHEGNYGLRNILAGARDEEKREMTQSPPSGGALDFEFFKTRVQPIFTAKRPGHARCISCHVAGTPLRLQPFAPGATTWNDEESRRNFDAMTRVAAPGNVKSRLLVHPLAESAGGDFFHNGGKHWTSQDDPEWQTLKAWVLGQKKSGSEQR